MILDILNIFQILIVRFWTAYTELVTCIIKALKSILLSPLGLLCISILMISFIVLNILAHKESK